MELLAKIASAGIDVAIRLGKIDPETATPAEFEAAGQAAILLAAQIEPAVNDALIALAAERMVAAHA